MRPLRALFSGLAVLLIAVGGIAQTAPTAAADGSDAEVFRPGVKSPSEPIGAFPQSLQASAPYTHIMQSFVQPETGHLASFELGIHEVTGANLSEIMIHEVTGTDPDIALTPVPGGSGIVGSETLPGPTLDSFWLTIDFPDRPLLEEGKRYALFMNPFDADGNPTSLPLIIDFNPPPGFFAYYVQATDDELVLTGLSNALYTHFASTLVEPLVEPTLVPAAQCGVEASVTIPDVTGVVFEESRDGNVITVTAVPEEGVTLTEDAVSTWTFDVTATPCPTEVTPVEPTVAPADQCGVPRSVVLPEVEGITYSVDATGTQATVTATADDGYIFADDATTEWTFDVTATPCPTEVTPVEPTLAQAGECGVESVVTTPEVDGLTYTQTRDGDTVTVVATAADGYLLADGATSEWAFDVAAAPCPTEVTPEAPTLVEAGECGVESTVTIPQIDGVTYTQTRDGDTVTVVATAADGYVLADGAATQWQFDVAATECEPEEPVDPEPTSVTPEAPTLVEAGECGVESTVTILQMDGVTYTQARDGDIVTVTAAAADGYVITDGAATAWNFDVSATECEPEEPVDPEPTDPEPTDPEPTDPEPTDPEPTDPAPVDPEPTDPEPTDPEPTDPADTDQPTETDQPSEGGATTPPGAQLPSTGSVAPTAFTSAAVLLLIAGTGILCATRRKLTT